jgi:hypothetical protein
VSYVLRGVFGIHDVYVWADVSWKEASHDGAGGFERSVGWFKWDPTQIAETKNTKLESKDRIYP